MFNSKTNTDKIGLIFLKGVIFGIIVTLVLMLVFAAAVLLLNLDRAYAPVLATVSIAAGSFIASMYAAKKIGGRGYLVGTLIGIATFALITVISLIIDPSGLTMNTLFHFVIIVLASVIGGIIGVNQGKNKKYI